MWLPGVRPEFTILALVQPSSSIPHPVALLYRGLSSWRVNLLVEGQSTPCAKKNQVILGSLPPLDNQDAYQPAHLSAAAAATNINDDIKQMMWSPNSMEKWGSHYPILSLLSHAKIAGSFWGPVCPEHGDCQRKTIDGLAKSAINI